MTGKKIPPSARNSQFLFILTITSRKIEIVINQFAQTKGLSSIPIVIVSPFSNHIMLARKTPNRFVSFIVDRLTTDQKK
jgi:hypothetical protein